MQSVRSFFFTLSGVTLVAILALFTASLTIAFAGILSVLMIARALTAKLKPVPVRAKSRHQQQQQQMRVWNDGRGTIIDM